MPRINLSIDDTLFQALVADANSHGCTVNVYLVSLLEKLYKQSPFDYATALATLEKEARTQPLKQEFILADLPSFTEICIAQAVNANLKPSTVRARLGKMFNTRVKNSKVGNVQRCVDNGNLKFRSRAAVYVRK